VIRRLYVHNFRCLENFELPVSGQSSVLLIGKNGAGKTTGALALEIFQKIARGTNRVGDLVKPEDLTRGRTDVPVRFEIEAEIDGKIYEYVIALELPEGFKELRVFEERLVAGGMPVYSRETAQVNLSGYGPDLEAAPRIDAQGKPISGAALMSGPARFRIDWHMVALPIIQERSKTDPIFIFKRWLARMLILRPIPALIGGESKQKTLEPNIQVTDFAAWFTGLLASSPAAYAKIDAYLKDVMPDLKDIQNPVTGKDSQSLVIRFSNEQGSMIIPFEDLSDGEKCFMICAVVLAANDAYGPLLCFWDEPDSYLAIDEVGHFVLALRKAFQSGGQFIATSHNPEAILRFSAENTLLLHRRSHLEPTQVRRLDELHVNGDLVSALIRGDVQP
jgi:predicted ATPase